MIEVETGPNATVDAMNGDEPGEDEIDVPGMGDAT